MISIEQELWGMTPEGEAVIRYTMRNGSGAEVRLTNLGAAVVGITLPDRAGKMEDVVLGYNDAAAYIDDSVYMGKCLGRTAGRTALGRMTINGKQISLDRNEGRNHLNGGAQGFSSKVWESRVETNRVVMDLMSEEGDQNYPATLYTEVVFDFDDDNSFEITYMAKSEELTVVNLAHSIYFNLGGEASGHALDQCLRLRATQMAEVDPYLVPTGRMIPIGGTSADFTSSKPLAEVVEAELNHIADQRGLAHPFEVEGWKPNILGQVGELYDPRSGRHLELLSSQASVVVDTANFIGGGAALSKSGAHYEDHAGVALICQNFPDAVNHPEFPSPLLEAGALYCQKTVYRFSVKE